MINKKGLSGVITAVILIALVMAATVILWTVIKNMVDESLSGAESCFGNYGKITLNERYTCYNTTSDELHFSISVGDVEVDEIIVLISGDGTTRSFSLNKTISQITGLTNYTGGNDIIIPQKNAGLTYVANGFAIKPDLIRLAPIIGGQQCEISDTVSNIEACFL